MRKDRYIQRFHTKYTINKDGCWIWDGSCTRSGGYPSIKYTVDSYALYGPRVPYYLFNGPIPEGMVVRHTCDTPACVNPDHLILGTQADNMRDMVNRNRSKGCGKSGVTESYRRGKTSRNDAWQAGDKNHQAKLDWETVRAIRSDSVLTLHQLKDKYGISVSQAHRIRNNLSWVE